MRNTAGNLLLWTIGTLLERLELPLFAVLLHKEVSWYSRPLCVALLHLEIPQGSRFVLFVGVNTDEPMNLLIKEGKDVTRFE